MPTPTTPKPTISRRKADRHEALFLRLAALARQTDAVAARRPQVPVPEDVRQLAEAALYESRGFRQHRRKGGILPAAPHYGGLSAQLGLALAEMTGFEARHTRWDGALKAQMWLVEGEPLPVRRLMPRLAAPLPPPAEDARRAAYMLDLRNKLAKRIEQYRNR